ncbi:MAG: ATP-binding protein [Bacteroidota bacterium]
MTASTRFALYLFALFGLAMGLAMYALRAFPLVLFATELLLFGMLYLGYRIYRSFVDPLRFMLTGADAIADRDFSLRFVPTSSPEMNRVIEVYNKMIDQLRQERLRQEEQHHFLIKLIQASPTGIILLDYDGRITEINPRALELLDLTSPVRGQPLETLHHPLATQLNALRVGEARIIKLQGIHRFKCQRSKFVDRGFDRHFVLMEELSSEILRSEKAAYGKVIRMMAHEVNNSVGPINSILQSVLQLAASIPMEQRTDVVEALRVAQQRNERLNQFMRNFARVVRLPAPAKNWEDLHQILRDLAKLLQPQVAERRIQLRLRLPDTPFRLQLDREQLEQALVNIIKNAMEAIERDGIIEIRTEAQPARLLICDDGPGIPAELKPQLFTPFFSTKAQGQGIGLTLVREILHQHGWAFSLSSPTTGKTIFEIRF